MKQTGFTLIELITVIVVLGVLGVTALGKFADLSSAARTSVLQSIKAATDSTNNSLRLAIFAGSSQSKVCSNFSPPGRVVEVYTQGSPPPGNCNLTVSRNDSDIAVMIWNWLDNDDLIDTIGLSGDLQENSDSGSPYANTYIGYDQNGNSSVVDDNCYYHYRQPLIDGELPITEVVSSGC